MFFDRPAFFDILRLDILNTIKAVNILWSLLVCCFAFIDSHVVWYTRQMINLNKFTCGRKIFPHDQLVLFILRELFLTSTVQIIYISLHVLVRNLMDMDISFRTIKKAYI